MRVLAIGKTPYYISYALFDNKAFIGYGKRQIDNSNNRARILSIRGIVNDLINELKPDFMATHLMDYKRILKKDLDKIVEMRTIFRMTCYENNVMYGEFKTDGWEKRITGLRPTNANKLKVINKGYGINVKDIEIADAIILGEGVAYNRLMVGDM